jgi:putative pyruvate formate lyase activating enzyme
LLGDTAAADADDGLSRLRRRDYGGSDALCLGVPPKSQVHKEKMKKPSYLELYQTGELADRVEQARDFLLHCLLCPHRCGVDRLHGELGVCGTGARAVVNDTMPHFGEEAPLVGSRGSGAIFFSHCVLACTFCQTYEISQHGEGTPVSSQRLAELMLLLQEDGCHNLNLITPTHVIPQILQAVYLAADQGFTLPLVYNTGGYDSLEGLRLLEGVIDIYLPDFKYWQPETAKNLCGAADYPEIAKGAIKEMHRQVGDLLLDDDQLAVRGVLARHLVLPGYLAETREIIRFLAEEISPHTYLNLMGHFRPCWLAKSYPPLNRTLYGSEYRTARRWAIEAGLTRLDQTHQHLYQHLFASEPEEGRG